MSQEFAADEQRARATDSDTIAACLEEAGDDAIAAVYRTLACRHREAAAELDRIGRETGKPIVIDRAKLGAYKQHVPGSRPGT